ncbi:hypothetical protein G6011_00997 [Alternaria panax]|uniref:Uncharacterized protein n=1 Tax=Alternaria panax TaxID=48097 RepID=A0AAD4NU57_9PLEO|nr:hypothetical protein G6011_00997 [Alternaria panax]
MPPRKSVANSDAGEAGGPLKWEGPNDAKLLLLTQGRWVKPDEYSQLSSIFPGTSTGSIRNRISALCVKQRDLYFELDWQPPEGAAGHGGKKSTKNSTSKNKTTTVNAGAGGDADAGADADADADADTEQGTEADTPSKKKLAAPRKKRAAADADADADGGSEKATPKAKKPRVRKPTLQVKKESAVKDSVEEDGGEKNGEVEQPCVLMTKRIKQEAAEEMV